MAQQLHIQIILCIVNVGKNFASAHYAMLIKVHRELAAFAFYEFRDSDVFVGIAYENFV
jgi:hypothetical protein